MAYAHSLAVTLAAAGLTVFAPAHAMTDQALAGMVKQRLQGDRTGACMAVAVVEAGTVARTYQCADAKDLSRIGPDSAFEIGSVSKTMTAALLADLIAQGSEQPYLNNYFPVPPSWSDPHLTGIGQGVPNGGVLADQVVENSLQPGPLVLGQLPGDARQLAAGAVDHVATGHGDVARQAGSLGPDRVLGDLHQHRLA